MLFSVTGFELSCDDVGINYRPKLYCHVNDFLCSVPELLQDQTLCRVSIAVVGFVLIVQVCNGWICNTMIAFIFRGQHLGSISLSICINFSHL